MRGTTSPQRSIWLGRTGGRASTGSTGSTGGNGAAGSTAATNGQFNGGGLGGGGGGAGRIWLRTRTNAADVTGATISPAPMTDTTL